MLLFDSECSCNDLQELGFDYLRDNLAGNRGQLVMRWYICKHNICLYSLFLGYIILTYHKQAKAIPLCNC